MATHRITEKLDPQPNRIFNRYSNMKFPKYSFEEFPKMLTLEVNGKPVRQTVSSQEEEDAYLAEYSAWKPPAPTVLPAEGSYKLPLRGAARSKEEEPAPVARQQGKEPAVAPRRR